MTSSGAVRGGAGTAVAIPGAIPDCIRFYDAAINVGTNQLTGATIPAGLAGQVVYVHNAGAGGVVPLVTTVVASVVGTATLAANAAATVAGQTAVIGTDNTAAITAAINNTRDGQRLVVPGPCLVAGAIPALAGSVGRGFVGRGGRTNFATHGTFAAPAGNASRAMPPSALVYVGGNLARFIDARHSAGFVIDGVAVFHVDSAFVGTIVDVGSDDATWSVGPVLHDATIGSLRGGASASCVNIRHVQGGRFEEVTTYGGDVQYRHTPVGGSANGLVWDHCAFANYGTVPVRVSDLEGSMFLQCHYYAGNGGNFMRWLDTNADVNDQMSGVEWCGGWCFDLPGGSLATVFVSGSKFGDAGIYIHGVRIGLDPAISVLYQVNAAAGFCRAPVIVANQVAQGTKLIDFNGKHLVTQGVDVHGNDWNAGAAGQVFSGTLPANSWMQGTNGSGGGGATAAPG